MKRFSSALTIPLRFLAPPLATLMAASFVYDWVQAGRLAGDLWPEPLAPVAIAIAFWLYFWPLKQVEYDGRELLISDYFREIRVPVGHITNVRQLLFDGNRTVILTFDPTTDFGRTIRLVPRESWENPFREDPLVRELRQDAQKARGVSG